MKNKYNQHFVVSKDIRQSVVLLLCNFNSLRYILGPLENGYPGSKDWMVVVLILGRFWDYSFSALVSILCSVQRALFFRLLHHMSEKI